MACCKPCSSRREVSFLGRRLNNLEALRNQLGDILVLVLQQPKREGDIVPLALRLAAWQTGRQLVRELLGMFVLRCVLAATFPIQESLKSACHGRYHGAFLAYLLHKSKQELNNPSEALLRERFLGR